jgi:hypothetical protein
MHFKPYKVDRNSSKSKVWLQLRDKLSRYGILSIFLLPQLISYFLKLFHGQVTFPTFLQELIAYCA